MKQKHIIVIGGTRGIGRAIVDNFTGDGHIVSAVGRKLASESVRNPKADYWFTDLAKENNTGKVIREILIKNGKISHIIFAQRYRFGGEDNWKGEIDISLTATKEIIEKTADQFDETEEKSIVVISSIANTLVCLDQPLSYHVAKAALVQMVRYFAVSLGQKGIRINSVSPAAVIKEESKKYYIQNSGLFNLFKKTIPLGRMGTPLDIANTVSFLCSPKSLYITGQNITVDGGFSLLAHEGFIKKIGDFQQKSK